MKRVVVLFARALILRCPNCGGGSLFRSWFKLKPSCPTCGLRLHRFLTDLGEGTALVAHAAQLPAHPHRTGLARIVTLQSPRIPVVSNVDAAVHSEPEEIRQLLVRQVISPVQWEDSVRWMLEQGVAEFTEIGPGKVLAGLLKRIDRKAKCENVNEAL